MNNTEAFPLYWPEGRQRTKHLRERSRFKTTFGRARSSIMYELRLLGAEEVILSTNIPLRGDGLPYANAREPEDPGVAVYFTYKKNKMSFACDRWDCVRDNLQAVGHTIEALRAIARWGTGDMMESAFKGFTALPAPRGTSWRDVLGITTGAPDTQAIETAYRRLRSQHHPDKGGDPGLFHAIQCAYEKALQET